MKHFLFLLFAMLVAISIYSQDEYKYQEVVDVPNQTPNEIFINLQTAINLVYNSAPDVIQFEDKDAGKIIGKALFHYEGPDKYIYTGSEGNVTYTFLFDVKEGKYRMTVENIKQEGPFGTFTNSERFEGRYKGWGDAKKQTVYQNYKESVINYLTDLGQSIKSKVVKVENDSNW
jgi:hypothetical protein